MCSCCSVTQQKFWVFGVGTLFLGLGILFIVWWPNFITETIYKVLPLTPTSRTFSKWFTPPLPIYLNMYLFNWTNPEQVYMAGVKPIFDKIGPYVFLEDKRKEDVTWNPDKTVTFLANRTWYFQPEMSGAEPDALITAPHLPTIAACEIVRDFPSWMKYPFNVILDNFGGSLYQTHTAMEWLFDGFYDQFLNFSMKLNSQLNITKKLKTDHFAYLLGRNGSKNYEGSYTINTGQDDLREMGELTQWNGKPYTKFYEGECGRINGSTGDLFVPNRGPDEFVTIFVADTKRIINLEPTHEEEVIAGITGWRYETTANTFDNGELNEDMKCYCTQKMQPNDCPKTGATYLGPGYVGAPVYLSLPNFLHGDESYRSPIIGLNPNPDEDKFFLVMEPKLGIPLEVNANIQVSLHIQNDSIVSILRDIENFYAPIFVLQEKARMTEDVARPVRLVLKLPEIGRDIGIAFVCLGGSLIIFGVVLTIMKCWHGQQSTKAPDDYPEKKPNIFGTVINQ